MQMPRVCLPRRLAVLLSLLLVGVLSACTTQRSVIPPISASGEQYPGQIVWHELLTSDAGAAAEFYAGLFGWQMEDLGAGYFLARHNGQPVAGLAQKRDADKRGLWLAFVSVEDVDAVSDSISTAGGSVHLPPTDLPQRGRLAVVADDQGSAFGLIDSRSGDPNPGVPGQGDWLWHEIWSTNPQASEGFYSRVFGLAAQTRRLAGADYRLLAHQGDPRIGLIGAPNLGAGHAWMAYVRVADPQATARLAEQLGGKVLLAPDEQVREGSVALIADPTGGALLVQHWNNEPVGN